MFVAKIKKKQKNKAKQETWRKHNSQVPMPKPAFTIFTLKWICEPRDQKQKKI